MALAIIRFVAIGGLFIVIGGVAAQRVFGLQPPATPRASGKPRQPVARPPMRAVKPVESAPVAIGAPLLLSLERLPTNYPGDAIEAVVASLKTGAKGEFETTTQYNSRVASIRPNRTYSFWLDREIVRRYDADRQILKISVPTGCVYVGDNADCNVASLAVKFVESKDAQYVGTNAFGASTVVSSVRRNTYALFLKRSTLSVDFDLSMQPEQARATKTDVDVLVTVGPGTETAWPFVIEGSSSSSATLASPLDSHEAYQYITLPLVTAWLASRASGQIFAKYDAMP